jgi:hypothetical protein
VLICFLGANYYLVILRLITVVAHRQKLFVLIAVKIIDGKIIFEVQMEKAIELLDTAGEKIVCAAINFSTRSDIYYNLDKALGNIQSAIAELKTLHQWETPEQWEKRTEEPWPDNGAVYVRQADGSSPWIVKQYLDMKISNWLVPITIICATKAGPPPDEWRPEGGKKTYPGRTPGYKVAD